MEGEGDALYLKQIFLSVCCSKVRKAQEDEKRKDVNCPCSRGSQIK